MFHGAAASKRFPPAPGAAAAADGDLGRGSRANPDRGLAVPSRPRARGLAEPAAAELPVGSPVAVVATAHGPAAAPPAVTAVANGGTPASSHAVAAAHGGRQGPGAGVDRPGGELAGGALPGHIHAPIAPPVAAPPPAVPAAQQLPPWPAAEPHAASAAAAAGAGAGALGGTLGGLTRLVKRQDSRASRTSAAARSNLRAPLGASSRWSPRPSRLLPPRLLPPAVASDGMPRCSAPEPADVTLPQRSFAHGLMRVLHLCLCLGAQARTRWLASAWARSRSARPCWRWCRPRTRGWRARCEREV
jgi:hypothetical protein